MIGIVVHNTSRGINEMNSCKVDKEEIKMYDIYRGEVRKT